MDRLFIVFLELLIFSLWGLMLGLTAILIIVTMVDYELILNIIRELSN